MTDTEHAWPPCPVFPSGTVGRIFAEHFGVVLVAAFLTCLLIPITKMTSGVGSVVLVALWVYALYRPTAKNTFLDFERRRRLQVGWVTPPEAIGPMGPRKLAVAVSLCLAVPFFGPVVAGHLAWRHIREVCHSFGHPVPNLLHHYHMVLCGLLDYPHSDYDTLDGPDALWLPDDLMFAPSADILLLSLPFYVAIGVPVTLLLAGSAPIMAAIVAVLALPLPGLTLAALTLRSLHELLAASEYTPPPPPPKTEWDRTIDRVRTSTYEVNGVAMADHLFLGWLLPSSQQAWHPFRKQDPTEVPFPQPALVPLDALDGHVHLSGPAQSGKTSNGLLSLLIQLIRERQKLVLDGMGMVHCGSDGEPSWTTSDPVPMEIIDLKGDLALFNTVREECAARGQTFRFFTPEDGKATSFFNPVTNLQAVQRPAIEFCEMTLNMLDLSYGPGYGRGYYSEQSRNLLLKTLKSARTKPESWEELYELLTDTLDRREHRDVFELLGRIFALAQYPVLGSAPDGIDTIHMPTVFENNECVYMWLPALESSMSVISIAKMALFCFMDAARKWNNSGQERKPSFVALDEAQVVCGQNMERVFQQASGARIRMLLSNQSLANLDTHDAPNLGRTIWTNTRVKQTFGLLDAKERRDWIDLSGEDIGILTAVATGLVGEEETSSTSYKEVVHTRLNQNVISEVNNSNGQSLLHVNGETGLTPLGYVPQQVRCPYPMSYSDYRRRSRTPWPEQVEPRVRGDAIETPVVNAQPPEEIENQAHDKYAALEQLFRDVARGSNPGGAVGLDD